MTNQLGSSTLKSAVTTMRFLLMAGCLMAVTPIAHAASKPQSLYERVSDAPIVSQVKVLKKSEPARPGGKGSWQVLNTVKVIRSFKGDMEAEAEVHTRCHDPKLIELRRKADQEADPQKKRDLEMEYFLNIPCGNPLPELVEGEEYILLLSPSDQTGQYRIFWDHSFFPATEKMVKLIEQACNPDLWTWGPEVNDLQLGAMLEDPYAYEKQGKLRITGIVMGLRNKSNETIKVLDSHATATVSVNGTAVSQTTPANGRPAAEADTWEIAPGVVLPLPENDRRAFELPCEFDLPMADIMVKAKQFNLSVTFSPVEDASGATWQGQLNCGPLLITPQE